MKASLRIFARIFFIVLRKIEVATVLGDKIKLADIHALTLYQGIMTNGRRSDPVPQLVCVGGNAGCSYPPKKWKCVGEMQKGFQFGKFSVTCEGYDHPDDKYVVKGSCGLEYNIDLTDQAVKNKNSYIYFVAFASIAFTIYATTIVKTSENVGQARRRMWMHAVIIFAFAWAYLEKRQETKSSDSSGVKANELSFSKNNDCVLNTEKLQELPTSNKTTTVTQTSASINNCVPATTTESSTAAATTTAANTCSVNTTFSDTNNVCGFGGTKRR